MSDNITIRCGKCGRTRVVDRERYEPPHATVAEFDCDQHEVVGKDASPIYFDADGKQIDWGAWMAQKVGAQ